MLEKNNRILSRIANNKDTKVIRHFADEEFAGHEGNFKLSSLSTYDAIIFARSFFQKRHNEDYWAKYTLDPRRPSKRAKVPEEHLLELKRMLPIFFNHCAISHTFVVFYVVEHVFEDPDWETVRASVNRALRDMVSRKNK